MGGDCVLTWKWQKRDLGADSWETPVPRLWALCSYLCIYLANFGGGLWGSPSFYEPELDMNATSLLCWLSPMALPSKWTFHSPKACQPVLWPGDRYPEALLAWKCPPWPFYTSPHVVHQAHALLVAAVLPPVLLDGCRKQ